MHRHNRPYRIIISGGGTGGHIYPAIAIANALKDKDPDREILFVGAEGRMEMQKVPAAGYSIEGLWISGIQRRLTADNLLFPVKVVSSLFKARKIIKDFQPDIAIGVGGYASFPLLFTAGLMKVPTMIQEQNGYAGVANKVLAKKAEKICVAYEGMDKFFPAEKLQITGNPVRKDILNVDSKREEAFKFFGLDPDKKTILAIGGSLGARTINESLQDGLQKFVDNDVQLLWQTGKFYYEKAAEAGAPFQDKGISVNEFIYKMDLAYAVADIVISRAGALSISELCLAEKPVILVPSPNVAEDHQTKNAVALTERNAARLVKDNGAREKLVDEALELLADEKAQKELKINIKKMGRPSAADDIAAVVEKVISEHKSKLKR
ncbi:undecaprenyldiphospho-muramoylpentapeptide beta-N-acetylglucosaminyltransferase [Cytophagaceae bacterium ABcell3]|nr:undecaprenyldiphospho-muramoylpentapeptide beta-N-acetylglucosaminyltransferase [Cytophagaceae bacterium ABcell3]